MAAARLLGRPFELEGAVARGAGRGRGLGFPTANVAPEGELRPKLGIYAARARVLDGPLAGTTRARRAQRRARTPQFARRDAVTVEAYLLDFEGDLYDRRLRLEVGERLRDEQRFDSIDALIAQIRRRRRARPAAIILTMFDTETMAELCVKQGLAGEALAIYRRLADATRTTTGAACTRRASARSTTPRQAPDVTADGDARSCASRRRGDEVRDRMAAAVGVATPALQMLMLRRTPDGIAAEPRTVPLRRPRAAVSACPTLHSLRVAAGRCATPFIPSSAAGRFATAKPFVHDGCVSPALAAV